MTTSTDTGVKQWTEIELGRFLLRTMDGTKETPGAVVKRVVEPRDLGEHIAALHCIDLAKAERDAVRAARGFTLIELLCCIAIIALLTGILLPALAGARDSAHSIGCMANLRSQGLAMRMYLDAGDGRIPFAAWPVDAAGGRVAPLDALADHLNASLPSWDDQAGQAVMLDPWVCPGDRQIAPVMGSSYNYAPAIYFQLLGRDARPRISRVFLDGHAVIVHDWLPFHGGAKNGLYGDGSVGKSR